MTETLRRPILSVSALALVDSDGRVLLAQRPGTKDFGGLWEFPGGKIEKGETPEQTVIREIREELGLDIESSCIAPVNFVSYPYENFHLILFLYICRKWEGRPKPLEGQNLAWVRPQDMAKDIAQNLATWPMPPADQPLVADLRDLIP